MPGESRDAQPHSRVLSFAHSRAERLFQEGVWYEEQGHDDEAIPLFERAVAADPDFAPARIALAYHYRRTERIPDAVEQAKRAVATQPSPATWYTLGYMLALNQRYDRALEALRRCLELDPTYDRAYHQIAFVYYLRGDYEVAITEFHRACLHEPDWQSLFFLGECYRLTRRLREARHVFLKALARADGWPQARITRGQLAACERLAEFAPSHKLSAKDQAYCDSGVLYLGSGQDDGLTIPRYPFYQFAYHDLAVTLHRLMALCAHHRWSWEMIVPVDELSLPLALALDVLLPHAPGGASTLHVQALGESVEPLQSRGQPAGDGFCLLVCWQEEWLPDITGLATPLRGALPWYHANTLGHLHSIIKAEGYEDAEYRVVWRDPRSASAITADILEAYHAAPADPTRDEQLRYYDDHNRLRWRHGP